MNLPVRRLLTAASLATALAVPAASILTAQAKPIGLIVVAHGADSSWNDRVRQTVAQLQWSHGPVRVAFLMGDEAETASWDSAATQIQRAGVGGLVVVPLMVSSWGSHVRQIQFYAGKLPALPAELEQMHGMGHDMHQMVKLTVPTIVTPALDDAPELGLALVGRWKELPAPDQRRPLMLIAHGPNAQEDVAHWESNILKTAQSLRDAVAPNAVRVALMRDDAPAPVRAASIAAMRDTIVALGRAAHDSVTVLPVLISTGSVNTVKIPADIAGLPVRYAGVGLAPHPALAKWIARVAETALNSLATTQTKVETGRQ